MEKGTVSKVLEYYFGNEKFIDEINRAKGEFFDFEDGSAISNIDDSVIPYFNEWIAFDFKLKNGKSLIEDFYDKNPYNLSIDKLQVYKELTKNEYGLFEVIKVDVGKGVEVLNLVNGNKYYISEKLGSYQMFPGCNIFVRISKIGSKYEFVGCDSIMFDIRIGKGMKKSLLEMKDNFNLKDVYQLVL